MQRTLLITWSRNGGGPCGYQGPMWETAIKVNEFFFETIIGAEPTYTVSNRHDQQHDDTLIIWELPKGYYQGKFVPFAGHLLAR